MIRCEKLKAGYGSEEIIHDIDWEATPGKMTVIVGPNGCGKSTLLKSLLGYTKINGGQVYLKETPLTDYGSREIAKQIAYLPQSRSEANISVAKMVLHGRFPYIVYPRHYSQEDQQKVEEALERMKIRELSHHAVSELSGGERQKAYLAMALAQDATILLLDEPTTYLDISCQLELMETLRELAREGRSIVVVLHDLNMGLQYADEIVVMNKGYVVQCGSPQEILQSGNLEKVFKLQVNTLKDAEGKPHYWFEKASEHYVIKHQKKLRCGVTTGTCAAAAAEAAATQLLLGRQKETVCIHTPKGTKETLQVHYLPESNNQAECYVIKDSGDDPDVTNHAAIQVRVKKIEKPTKIEAEAFCKEGYATLFLVGGTGVGRVTREGLEQAIGQAAINAVPRSMIFEAVEEVCKTADYQGELLIVIEIPRGEELAIKTFNNRLGIVGGISILGTSGVIEPMSEKAIVDTIEVEIRQLQKQGIKTLLVTPGNYGKSYVTELLGIEGVTSVKSSNYIGETLDLAVAYGMTGCLLVGNIGKLVKLAAGIMNTHSKMADGRCEIFAVHTVLCGGTQDMVQTILACCNTEEILTYLEQWKLREAVIQSLCKKIQEVLRQRVGESMTVGVILCSERFGQLGQTEETSKLLAHYQESN